MPRRFLAQRLVVLLTLASSFSLFLHCGGDGTGTSGPGPGPGPLEPIVSGAWIPEHTEYRQGSVSGSILSSVPYTSANASRIYVMSGGVMTIFTRGADVTDQNVEYYDYREADSVLSFGSVRVKAWLSMGQLILHETTPDTTVLTFFDRISGTVPPLPSGWPQLDSQRPDPFEIDDEPARATPITYGTTSPRHSFFPVGDEDWFSFPADAGATYTFSCHGVPDVQLRVLDRDGALTIQHSAFPDTGLVWNCSTTGTYYFVANHTGVDTTIWYTISLTREGPRVNQDAAEPDYDAYQAKAITTNASLPRTISPAGDQDWFRFEAVAGVAYTMQTRGDLDTWIDLIDTDRTSSLRGQDGGGSGLNARVTWTCNQAGSYYIKVTAKQPSVTGAYDVDLACNGSSSLDALEPDNSADLANQLLVDAPVQMHRIDPASDDDFMFINATSGTTYLIQTHGTTNTNMVLYNADKTTRIQENDDYSGVNAGILWTCDLTGRYYVRVNEYGYNATGSYTIDVVTQ